MYWMPDAGSKSKNRAWMQLKIFSDPGLHLSYFLLLLLPSTFLLFWGAQSPDALVVSQSSTFRNMLLVSSCLVFTKAPLPIFSTFWHMNYAVSNYDTKVSY